MRRSSWVFALLALGAEGGLYVAFGRGSKKPGVHYETQKVERGRLVARVTATGTLSALVTVQVGAQVSGRINEIKVDFNSPVKKGQVIARIDPQLFVAAIEQTKANLLAAQANLEKSRVQAADARLQSDRSQELFEKKLVAQADRDTARATADAAAAQVNAGVASLEQAKAAYHQAQINLDYCTIVSPTNGTVISRSVDVGQTVAAAFQAPTLFTIAEDLRKMQVDTSVAEADVGRLQDHMIATFTVDAYPNEKFKGTIRQVRNAPQTLQNVVTYDAVIDVDNSELKLKPGMTANVTFIHAEREGVLRVANAAMRFHPAPDLLPGRDGVASPELGERPHGKRDEDPTARKVWVLRDGSPIQVPIHIGVTDGTLTEVTDGDIREGDLAITDASGDLKKGPPGMRGPRMF